MYKIGTLNKISQVGLNRFSDKYHISEDTSDSVGIIVRSQSMHDMEFGPNLQAIARAGAGVNNIPLEKCADKGIVVFNAPGANANAVKELVISSIIIAARNLLPAFKWTGTLTEDISKTVEKGKSQFAGGEIAGKTLGVIGLGSVGQRVADAAVKMNMDVIGYDPALSVKAALKVNPSVVTVKTLDDLLTRCDYITLHVPFIPSTAEIIREETIKLMKDNVTVLNFSRDKLVNEDDMITALKSGKISKYVTDFPTEKLLNKDNVVSLPHLGASTKEAEDNCAIMAAEELMDFIENGNIVNSVNFPEVDLGPIGNSNRICIFTKGEPYPVKLALAMFADKNITGAAGGVRGEYGYALLSTTDDIETVPKVEEVIKVRILQDI